MSRLVVVTGGTGTDGTGPPCSAAVSSHAFSAAGDIGWAMWKPWSRSQPMPTSASYVPWSSTPSATTLSPSACPSFR